MPPVLLCLYVSLSFSLVYLPSHTFATPRIPDSPHTMTPRPPRRKPSCLSLSIVGLCSLFMPNVGHVYGLTIPFDSRSFPASSHSPHPPCPHFSPRSTFPHRSFEKAALNLATAPEVALQDVHTRIVLRKRANDDKEGYDGKDSSRDGHRNDDHHDNGNGNGDEGSQDNEDEDLHGNESDRQDESHYHDTDESDHRQDPEEAERAGREQEYSERLQREQREKKEEVGRESSEHKTEQGADEALRGEVGDEQQGNSHDRQRDDSNSSDLDGVSNRNDSSNGVFSSMPLIQDFSRASNSAIIAGSVAGVVFLACVILGFVLLHKRQAKKRSAALETYFSRKIEVHPMSSYGIRRSDSNGSNGNFERRNDKGNCGTLEMDEDHTHPKPRSNDYETERPWSIAPMSSVVPALIPSELAQFDYPITDHQGPSQFHAMEDEDFETLALYSRGYNGPTAISSIPSCSSTPELLQIPQLPPLVHRPTRASYQQDLYPNPFFHQFTQRFKKLDPLAEVDVGTAEIGSELSSGSSPNISADTFPVSRSIPVLHSDSETNSLFMVRPPPDDAGHIQYDPDLRTSLQPPMSISEPVSSCSPSVESSMTMEQSICEANYRRMSVYDGDGQRLQAKRAGSLLFS